MTKLDAISFRLRRQVALATTITALLGVAATVWILESRLAHTSFFTGALLLGSVLFLSLLGVRKRLPVIPLLTASTWTQVHIYTGLFCCGVYLLHVPNLIGGGIFESGLSIVFLLVTASGLYGIVASRTYPRRLTAVEGQYRFDQIDWHRCEIAETANQVLDQTAEPTSANVLKSYFRNELDPFFQSGPSLAYVAFPTGRRRQRLLNGLRELDRYIESEGRRAAGRIAALIRRRDDLDYQYALQLRLRAWVCFHSLASVALLAGGAAHAVIAWRFSG